MLKDRRMTVVGRLEGLIQADDLINQLIFIMDANQTYLVSERLERYELAARLPAGANLKVLRHPT